MTGTVRNNAVTSAVRTEMGRYVARAGGCRNGPGRSSLAPLDTVDCFVVEPPRTYQSAAVLDSFQLVKPTNPVQVIAFLASECRRAAPLAHVSATSLPSETSVTSLGPTIDFGLVLGCLYPGVNVAPPLNISTAPSYSSGSFNQLRHKRQFSNCFG